MSSSSTWNHAQNFSAQKIGEGHREGSVGVSIHQVAERRTGENLESSYSSQKNMPRAVSSINGRPAKAEDPDDRRYQSMRGLILKQKAGEARRQKSAIGQIFRGDENKKSRSFMRKLVDDYNPKKDIGKNYDRELRQEMKQDVKTALRRGRIDSDTAELMRDTINKRLK